MYVCWVVLAGLEYLAMVGEGGAHADGSVGRIGAWRGCGLCHVGWRDGSIHSVYATSGTAQWW
eukprot:3230693-Ditylum_brightwellii.AAC.1